MKDKLILSYSLLRNELKISGIGQFVELAILGELAA